MIRCDQCREDKQKVRESVRQNSDTHPWDSVYHSGEHGQRSATAARREACPVRRVGEHREGGREKAQMRLRYQILVAPRGFRSILQILARSIRKCNLSWLRLVNELA